MPAARASTTRREAAFGGAALASTAALAIPARKLRAAEGISAMLMRSIPSSGEKLPVIGLGTWQTFDVGYDAAQLAPLREVMDILFQAGGRMIDSSPMYGRAEAVTGKLLTAMNARERAFIATKVWTSGERAGIAQMQASSEKMAAPVIDLMQIHNLVDWRTHLKTLRAWKEQGKIRYIGITHYTTSAFGELESVMKAEKVDFLQLPYSLDVRAAEQRLLPLALERGVAVIPNRPFEGGEMFRRVRGRQLPAWAAEIEAKSFGQVFLKYLVAHPAITCIIPATANPKHMQDNVQAGSGSIPDEMLQKRIAKWWDELG